MGVINLSILIEKVRRKLLKSGFVTNTDYASNDVAGVIKTASSFGTTVNSSGVLTGISRSESNYMSGSNGLIISKGTLEAVISTLVQRELIAALGGTDSDPQGTTITAWKATKGADGWTITATKS